MEHELIHACLLVEGDYIYVNRRKYKVLSRSRLDDNNVRLLIKRNALHRIMICEQYDTFKTIPSPKLQEGN